MGRLEGKTALITGGTSGIGLATAKQFVSEGAYVFITGRRDPELASAVKEMGRNVTGVRGDVSNLDDLDHLFEQIKREKSKLDIVFANAGVATYSPFGKITEEHYDSIFNINVKGDCFAGSDETLRAAGRHRRRGALSHLTRIGVCNWRGFDCRWRDGDVELGGDTTLEAKDRVGGLVIVCSPIAHVTQTA
jgi:NAD(P)-dependent dehydrogenase (short-subunit alcohol dehydrogenase family)